MDDKESLIGRAKAELREELSKPADNSIMCKGLRMSEEEWKKAAVSGQMLAEQSAIWSLEMKALQYLRENPISRWRSPKLIVLIAAVIAGLSATYMGFVYERPHGRFLDFVSYDSGEFISWLIGGVLVGAGLALSVLRLPFGEQRNGLFSAISGMLLAFLISYGPGRRGTVYWLAHGGAVRLIIGAVVALLVFEIWRHRKK